MNCINRHFKHFSFLNSYLQFRSWDFHTCNLRNSLPAFTSCLRKWHFHTSNLRNSLPENHRRRRGVMPWIFLHRLRGLIFRISAEEDPRRVHRVTGRPRLPILSLASHLCLSGSPIRPSSRRWSWRSSWGPWRSLMSSLCPWTTRRRSAKVGGWSRRSRWGTRRTLINLDSELTTSETGG